MNPPQPLSRASGFPPKEVAARTIKLESKQVSLSARFMRLSSQKIRLWRRYLHRGWEAAARLEKVSTWGAALSVLVGVLEVILTAYRVAGGPWMIYLGILGLCWTATFGTLLIMAVM